MIMMIMMMMMMMFAGAGSSSFQCRSERMEELGSHLTHLQ